MTTKTSEKITVKVTVMELVMILMTVVKGTFVHVVMNTVVRMNKTNNPFFNMVSKVSSGNYLMGNSYQDRVNSNYVKEGIEPTFVSEKPSGKHHVSECVLFDDETNTIPYVMIERFNEIHPTVEYVYNGNPIEKQMFESFMVKVSESQKQEQEKKVYPLTPKVENITSLTLNGVIYEVVKE